MKMKNYEAMIKSVQLAYSKLESSEIGYGEANAHSNLAGQIVKLAALKCAENKFLGDKTALKFLKVNY